MGAKTEISWTDSTWNPVTGCVKVSPGCANCYAERFSERFRGVTDHAFGNGFDLTMWPERLNHPLRWKRPRKIFTCSMSDLFQEGVSFDYLDMVFAVMAIAQRHTFQVLTKRADRMREYVGENRLKHINMVAKDIFRETIAVLPMKNPASGIGWPLPNVWLGVSVEDQKRCDERVPYLLDTPAAVRFVSAEPLLGEVRMKLCALCGNVTHHTCKDDGGPSPSIDWVIVGGESGPGARFMPEAWARAIVRQCQQREVSVFVKQMGSEWAKRHGHTDSKGGDWDHWPVGLRVREFPPTPAT